METTASEIARYKGNADSVIGSSEGFSSGANLVWGETDATRINQRIDAVSVANLEKNRAAYELKIKNRNELFDKIESKELSVNQMLPKDRDLVREKYLKPMRDMMIRNPDLRSDPDQYVKFQQLAQDFEEAKNYGSHRYVLVSAMDKDIATETDPEKKKRMMEHRATTEGQGLFQEVKPYQQTLDWGKETFVTVPPLTSTTEDMVGDKIVTTTNSHTPLKEFVKGSIHNYTDSPNKALKNQMDVYADSFHGLSDDLKAQKILLWNEKIMEANKDEGLQNGDPDFVQPIVSHRDATGRVIVAETPQRIVLAESILQGYHNTKSVGGKISKTPSEIEKNKAEVVKTLAEARIKIPADAAEKYAEANKKKEDIRVSKRTTGKEDAKGDYYINQLVNMTNPENYKGLPRAEDAPQFKDSKLRGSVLMGLDDNGQVRSALSPEELKALGTPYMSTQGIDITIPTGVIYNTDDPKDPYFITIYDPKPKVDAVSGLPLLDKDKKPVDPGQTVVKIVRPNRVLERLVKGTVGETTTGKEGDEYQNTTKRYRERAGTENINGSVLDLPKHKDWQTKPDAPAPAKPAKPKKRVPAPKGLLDKKNKIFSQ